MYKGFREHKINTNEESEGGEKIRSGEGET
jgi:hypothetical protein